MDEHINAEECGICVGICVILFL